MVLAFLNGKKAAYAPTKLKASILNLFIPPDSVSRNLVGRLDIALVKQSVCRLVR